jgi:hypothetical protein
MGRYTSDVVTIARPTAHAALAQAITNSRKGRSAPLREQQSGKLDRRRLARVGVGDTRVFIRRGAPAPDKVRVTILVDASGSMNASNARRVYNAELGRYEWPADVDHRSLAQIAAQTCRDLAGATDLLPWVTADVVAFTTGGPGVILFPLWQTGEPTSDIDAYGKVPMAGTEEGYAIAFAQDELQEHLKGREQGLIIIISDGAPGEPKHVRSVVDSCAKNSIPVVSVALVDNAIQRAMYGRDNVVVFDSNVRKLARDMARVIGRVL